MMRSLLSMFAVIAFCGCAFADGVPAESGPIPPKNILFVGNSFIYYNNSVHNHYRELLKSVMADDEPPGRVRSMTISGGQLPEHAAGLPSMLASDDWDIVVLQGHSRGPIEEVTAAPFREAAREYSALIRDNGAEPAFFMTWAYTDRPAMTPLLDAAYTDIARELNARVVPVGLAFAAVSVKRPEISLRTADAKHPTIAGTYLAACTFFAVFHGVSPEGIDYTAGLETDIAQDLQRAAWRVVTDYRRRER